jgi:hypothetical protein
MFSREKEVFILAGRLLALIGAGCGSSQQEHTAATTKPPTTGTLTPYVMGQTLNFNEAQVDTYLGKGWGVQESWGRWTDGHFAGMKLPLEGFSKESHYTLTLECTLFQPDKQRVIVSLNGVQIGEIGPGFRGPAEVRIPFQGELLWEQNNLIHFEIEDPVSPKELGESPDPRRIGLGAFSLRIDRD